MGIGRGGSPEFRFSPVRVRHSDTNIEGKAQVKPNKLKSVREPRDEMRREPIGHVGVRS